jgi:flagellar biosynthesis protein FliQ
MSSSTIVIHKSGFGLLVIYIAGALLVAALLLGLASTIHEESLSLTDTLPKLIMVAIVVVVIGTFVQAYIYLLSKITIRGDSLTVTSWSTLFFVNTAVTEFRHINYCDVKKTSIFSQLFDYGTVLASTASGERNMTLSLIPNSEPCGISSQQELTRRQLQSRTCKRPTIIPAT